VQGPLTKEQVDYLISIGYAKWETQEEADERVRVDHLLLGMGPAPAPRPVCLGEGRARRAAAGHTAGRVRFHAFGRARRRVVAASLGRSGSAAAGLSRRVVRRAH
jgi:hypothetical protein